MRKDLLGPPLLGRRQPLLDLPPAFQQGLLIVVRRRWRNATGAGGDVRIVVAGELPIERPELPFEGGTRRGDGGGPVLAVEQRAARLTVELLARELRERGAPSGGAILSPITQRP